jgi:hypothetical protein
VVIDTGYRTREIYGYVIEYGFIGIKGTDKRVFVHKTVNKKTGAEERFPRFWKKSPEGGDPAAGTIQAGKAGKAAFFLLGTESLKDMVARLREGKTSEFLALPSASHSIEEFHKQMFSEYKGRIGIRNGKKIYGWKRIGDIPNHYWDCVIYIFGRASMNPAHNFKEMVLPSTDWFKDNPEAVEEVKEAA